MEATSVDWGWKRGGWGGGGVGTSNLLLLLKKTQLVLLTIWTGPIDEKIIGSLLDAKSNFKMLELSFSSKLDWDPQIVSITKTASKKIILLIGYMQQNIVLNSTSSCNNFEISHIDDRYQNLVLSGFFLFLVGVYSMQAWTATTRPAVTRKRSTKRLKHTGHLFRKNLQFIGVTAMGLFQKILLNTIAYMYWTIWCKCYRWVKIAISK